MQSSVVKLGKIVTQRIGNQWLNQSRINESSSVCYSNRNTGEFIILGFVDGKICQNLYSLIDSCVCNINYICIVYRVSNHSWTGHCRLFLIPHNVLYDVNLWIVYHYYFLLIICRSIWSVVSFTSAGLEASKLTYINGSTLVANVCVLIYACYFVK